MIRFPSYFALHLPDLFLFCSRKHFSNLPVIFTVLLLHTFSLVKDYIEKYLFVLRPPHKIIGTKNTLLGNYCVLFYPFTSNENTVKILSCFLFCFLTVNGSSMAASQFYSKLHQKLFNLCAAFLNCTNIYNFIYLM